MTAQVPDHVVLDGVEYALVGVAGAPLFDPRAAGLEPGMISTGCWRGYVCRYAVEDGRLVLSRLFLGLGTRRGGEVVAPGAEVLGRPAVVGDGPVGRCLEVADPAVPVPFTGTLLLGRDFVQATYVHMGFHPAWKYATVVELVVADGVVGEVVDRSAEFAETRRRVLAGETDDPDGPPGGPGWVARTFRVDDPRRHGGVPPPNVPPQ